ncbi:MAG: hypothetical protein HY800_04210, partial [Ignavibacteriales bacterium]|nr:hypothetical protein [Ignavibacteriales bacterium]
MGIKSGVLSAFLLSIMLLLVTGCASKSDGVVNQISKNIDFMTRDNPDRQFNGNDVKLVEELASPISGTLKSSNNPEKGDALNIDIMYKIKKETVKSDDGFFSNLPWNKPRLVLTTLIPKTIANKQSVLSVDFSLKPTRVFDVGDNRYAEFEVNEIKGSEEEIHIRTSMQLFQYDF